MDLSAIQDFIFQHGLYTVIMILILVFSAFILSYLGDWFRKVKIAVVKRKSKYLDKSIIEIIQLLVNVIFGICMLVLAIFITSIQYPEFRGIFWEYFSLYFTPLVSIVITVIIIVILGQVIRRFFRFLRITLRKRPGTILKPETTRFIELLLVYLIYTIGLSIVLIIGLAAVGLSDPIRDNFVYFAENYLASVILIIIFLVIIYGISRFVSAFINDLKAESTRYNPATLDLIRNMVNYIFLITGILIVIFSLFNISGMGELGESILIAVIIVFGFIIAISASGTLGNFFAGLVLLLTSPFEPGETIKIGNGTVGKIQAKQLFSTIILSDEGEEIKLPNSKVLDSQIVNYSRSKNVPITADVKVNYKVTSNKVHQLLRSAAETTPGINLDDKPPKVYTVKFEPTSIKYRLVVYIEKVVEREDVNTKLLDNIQDTFNKAEVSFKG